MSKREQQFQLWLDGELTNEQSQQFEQRLDDDLAMQQKLATARFIEQQVHCYEQQSVPEWDRGATFSTDKDRWWQWQGLPALSLSVSIFAIALVLFNVELVIKDKELLVNFGGQSQQPAINVEQLIDQRLQEFATEQQVVMANYASDLKDNQQSNNLQLATYLLATTRGERQQDMSSFIKYVNEQRDEDAIDSKLRYQRLEYEMQNQAFASAINKTPEKLKLQKTNFTGSDHKEN